MKSFIDKFQAYIDENEMVDKSEKILLTVSGGVDSMVMMHLFASQGYDVGVAHCNFQLRGDESDEDEVVVAEEATKLGLKSYNKRFDTLSEMERTGDSMEMVARQQRYEWFEQLSQEHGYSAIAIAHHMDDSIETFFINLLRGTGLRGLTGITTQRGKIFRPLMFATRKEILEYATANHIQFREDSSNRSTKYLRNKIRLGLIPRIIEIQSKFVSLMRRNLSQLDEAQLFIDSCIEQIGDSVISLNNGIYKVELDKISEKLPLNFVIYQLLSTRFGFKGDVVEELIQSLCAKSSGKRFYARKYVAYVDRGDILVTEITPDDLCQVEVTEDAQRTYCGNSQLTLERMDIDLLESLKTPENIALLDADRLKYPLTLRKWQEGDSLTPFGMNGRKLISDMLIDLKVSMPEKQRQFVLLSDGKIVWLVGQRISDEFKIGKETENVLKITKEII